MGCIYIYIDQIDCANKKLKLKHQYYISPINTEKLCLDIIITQPMAYFLFPTGQLCFNSQFNIIIDVFRH